MRFLKWTSIGLISVILILTGLIAGIGWLLSVPVNEETSARIGRSDQHAGDRFVNEEPEAGLKITPGRVAELVRSYPRQSPIGAIPVVPIGKQILESPPSEELQVAWLGHAGVLIEVDGKRILIDPIVSERASPVGFAGPGRFHPSPLSMEELAGIDAAFITHNHYDHLDKATLLRLTAQGTRIVVPLGNRPLLLAWGIPESQVTELDWWQDIEIGDVRIVATPARHYSNRGLFDFKKTLWVSWSIIGRNERIFVSGDSGYTTAFSKIGAELGPFDLTIVKVGAYGPGQNWRDIHMPPEESIQTHLDVKGRIMLPVHWGTFDLGNHEWDEPIKRTLAAADSAGVKLLTPKVGEFVLPSNYNSTQWWAGIE